MPRGQVSDNINTLSIRADVSINLALPLYQIAPMESDGMSRFFSRTPRNVTKPLNICSDFHLGRHFFGLVGGFFVGLSVTLPHEVQIIIMLS